MAELAREEIEALQQTIEELGDQLKIMLLPKDPLDDRNIMLEVGGVDLADWHSWQTSWWMMVMLYLHNECHAVTPKILE